MSELAIRADLQKGLDLGVVSPEVLQNYFDLEQYPFISELTHRFQRFRERLLADPKFLHRLAIEEAISITTTLLAQYERHKENFFEELDYVIMDTVGGSVVDFFTIWLPAPTLSFLSIRDTMDTPDNMEALKGLLGSIPDNAFQRNIVGKDWNVNHRVASVLFSGLKLVGVGFISSIGTVVTSNILYAIRKLLNPAIDTKQLIKRSPILKTTVVYGGFLGNSSDLRYQVAALNFGDFYDMQPFFLPIQTSLVLMLYGGPMSKLRLLMIYRMAKLEEVLIAEDENGNIVSETMKDNDVLVQYKVLNLYLADMESNLSMEAL
ncbi:hypothetical protein ACSBR2_035082 [Camellia fascicularis]